jgi:hypothetical protein
LGGEDHRPEVSTLEINYQWPFQDPKLEVPTIRPM